MLQFTQSKLRNRGWKFITALVCCVVWLHADEPLEPGLKLTFTQDRRVVDVITRSHFALYVPAGASATPFMSSGPFGAAWDGYLSIPLRSQYTFHARFRGELKLSINGVTLLDTNSMGAETVISRPIRLSKGTNSIQALFVSPKDSDAMLRMEWAERRKLPEPIPARALSHGADPELQRQVQLRIGRELMIEYRCLRCHAGSEAMDAAELLPDAPSFVGIGSRRMAGWMARWIADPKKARPAARMPRLLHGTSAAADAEAIAAYLDSLKSGGADIGKPDQSASATAGEQLFQRLQCAACHVPPLSASEGERGPSHDISLAHLGEKFAPGALAAYLRDPSEGYEWTRMPDYRLEREEAAHLAAYLTGGSSSETPRTLAHERAERVGRGKRLIQTVGCLNCHAADLENRFSARSLAELRPDSADGCLSAPGSQGARVPEFGFSEQERAALRAFLATDRGSLARVAAAEFAEREVKQLRCAGCHEQVPGLPALELLGGKLKPEWAAAFISGEVRDKPRPWLGARMPAFKSRAVLLAEGMAMLHGYPPVTAPEPPVDVVAADVGRKLVSAQGGFACVACHAVGDASAEQVLDHPGINLAYSSERLLRPYFERWLLNPLAVDPTTKMPVYFDEQGRSALFEVYDGDGRKQIAAIWEYLRLEESKDNQGRSGHSKGRQGEKDD